MEPENQNGPWWQCYQYFGLDNRGFDDEVAALRLAFYLANFGMFRGKAPLRDKNLEFFIRLTKFCRNYSDLRNLTLKDLQKPENQKCVAKFLKELRKFLKKNDAGDTKTLVTKIALATTACVPAYDRFVERALEVKRVSRGLSKESLRKMFAACESNGALTEFVQNPDDTVPIMRHLDRQLLAHGKKIDHEKAMTLTA